MSISRATRAGSSSAVTEFQFRGSQQNTNDALMTDSESSDTCADDDELSEELKNERCDVKVKMENRLEKGMKDEGEFYYDAVTEMQSATVTDVGPGEPRSASGDTSEPLNIQDIVPASAASSSGSGVDDAYNEVSVNDSGEYGNIFDVSRLLVFL